MTKAEVVASIATKTGLDRADVSTTLETFFKVIKTSMSEGENVYVRGFGSFTLKKRAQKTARNITQKKTVIIPEHYIPSFKPADIFMEKVKESDAVKKLLKG